MRVAILLCTLILAACAGREPVPWTHSLLADHPLVGRIFDPKTKTFVDEATALRRAAAADYLLLGERHDNADHHRLQADVVRAALAADSRRRIALEMLNPEQGPAAATFMASRPMDAAGFDEAVGWNRNWRDWPMYRPIIERALTFAAPVVPANLDRAEVQALRRGPEGLSAERRAALRLDQPIPAEFRAAMEAEIVASHCGMPITTLAPFTAIQWARDAAMAAAMTDGGGKAILIAGAGHVRTDRAVPWHLRARQAQASIVSIAFREVVAGETDPTKTDWPYDLVWFTPRVDDVDPCVRFRERMQPGARSAAWAPTSPPGGRRG